MRFSSKRPAPQSLGAIGRLAAGAILFRLSLLSAAVIFMLAWVPLKAHAAACCGGGFSVPALITGDDAALATFSYSYAEIADDIDAEGIWTPRNVPESAQVLRVEAAHIFHDRFQVGASLPYIFRDRYDGTSPNGFGDASLTGGYEYLPDWDYNPWRPHGIGFLQLTLPTGKSIYEAEDPELLDARGRGFFALGAGTFLAKTFGRWDANAMFELHRAFPRPASQQTGTVMVTPGWGGNVSLGGGASVGDWRFGASLTWTYEDPVDVSGSLNSSGSPQRFATGSVMANYLISENWAATLSYADQTLFGQPSLTSLSRSGYLSLQRRWAR